MKRSLLREDTARVYDFIQSYVAAQNGRPPTQREIAQGCYMARSSVQRHLDILDARGLIVREPGMARGMYLTKPDEDRA